MSNARAALLLTCFLLVAGNAVADQLVTDISDNEIELKYSFAGRTLLLFGAIDHQGAPGRGAIPYDIVLRITGPDLALVVRKKAQIAGIWVNTSSVTYPAAPGYYAVASNRPLPNIASSEVLDDLALGLEHIRPQTAREQSSGKRADFDGGLRGSMKRSGLYGVDGRATILKNTLFRGEFRFPSNVPEGEYRAEAFLFQDGRFLSRQDVPLHVGKTGLARQVYAFANDSPALYGLLAVLIALTAGWIAGAVAKK